MSVSLGGPLVDEYLRFTAARVRPNTLIAQAYDLKVFFTVVPKPPLAVSTGDVLAFIQAQRPPRRGANVVRLLPAVRGLGHFPNEASAMKTLYPATTSLDPKGTGQTR